MLLLSSAQWINYFYLMCLCIWITWILMTACKNVDVDEISDNTYSLCFIAHFLFWFCSQSVHVSFSERNPENPKRSTSWYRVTLFFALGRKKKRREEETKKKYVKCAPPFLLAVKLGVYYSNEFIQRNMEIANQSTKSQLNTRATRTLHCISILKRAFVCDWWSLLINIIITFFFFIWCFVFVVDTNPSLRQLFALLDELDNKENGESSSI